MQSSQNSRILDFIGSTIWLANSKEVTDFCFILIFLGLNNCLEIRTVEIHAQEFFMLISYSAVDECFQIQWH